MKKEFVIDVLTTALESYDFEIVAKSADEAKKKALNQLSHFLGYDPELLSCTVSE